jgi:hypothetical protein
MIDPNNDGGVLTGLYKDLPAVVNGTYVCKYSVQSDLTTQSNNQLAGAILFALRQNSTKEIVTIAPSVTRGGVSKLYVLRYENQTYKSTALDINWYELSETGYLKIKFSGGTMDTFISTNGITYDRLSTTDESGFFTPDQIFIGIQGVRASMNCSFYSVRKTN